MQLQAKQKMKEDLTRLLLGVVLLVTVFLCTLLTSRFIQSTVNDYQAFLMDELRQAAAHMQQELASPTEENLAALPAGMERYFAGHDLVNAPLNHYHTPNVRFALSVSDRDETRQVFSYQAGEGFTADTEALPALSPKALALALDKGEYLGFDGASEVDKARVRLVFELDGRIFSLSAAVPDREPLHQTLPVILGIFACILIVIVALFLLTRYNQSLLYEQAVKNAKRTQLVLDHLQTSVHVTRPETGELLFMNRAMRDANGLTEETMGERCWEVFYGDRARCEFCPLYELQGDPSKAVVWEMYDADSGTTCLNTDHLIEWDDGSIVLMEHSMDITEQRRAVQRMQRQVERQKLLSSLSLEVAASLDAQSLTGDLLSTVGNFLGADRAWVMHSLGGGRMEYVGEWHQPQFTPLRGRIPFIQLDMNQSGLQKEVATRVQVVPLPHDLPVSDTAPYEQLRLYSNVYVLLMIGGEMWGMLCFSMQERTREWSEEDLEMIRTFSGILSASLQNGLIQARLQDTQRTLRSILEHIPLGIYWKDKDSRYIGCNQKFITMMGAQTDSVEGKTDAELFPPAYAQDYYATDQIAINTGEIYEDFVRSRLDEGAHQPRFLRRKKLAVWGEDGKVAFLLGIVEDITTQKRAELARDESLSMLRAAMKNYPGILFSLDQQQRIVVVGGRGLVDSDEQDFDALSGQLLGEVYPDIPELVSRSVRTYTEGPQAFSVEFGGKVYNFFTSQMLDAQGGVTGIVVTGLDMTQEMRLRRELEDAIVAAETASNAKSDFLSRMSHEIRTPMNVIIGMCRMALRAKDPAKAKHSLLQIDASAKQLLGLINDILDMSKIEANKLSLHNEPFDIEKTLMDICSGVQVRAAERHQSIQVLMARGMPHNYIGDELRLSQVITNLFTNAIKFSPDHGNIVLSMKELSREGDILTLETRVRDHGIGMTQEQIDRLFVSFEQADGGIARKYGGTGLGLAICKSIVTMMDGDIWAESEYGKGSTFIFTVKMQLAPDQTKKEDVRDLRAENLHTLVVDASAETGAYIADIMEGFGIACDRALSGDEARAQVKKATADGKPYDIVFVDWLLPGMDGLETVQELKKADDHLVPVIMIPSADLSEAEDEAKALGVRYFVPKPLFPSDLFNVVHNILGLGNVSAPRADSFVTSAPNLRGHVILLAEDMEFNREVAIGILEETGCEVEEAINGMEAVEKFKENPTRYSCILMDMQMPGVDGLEATRMIRAMKDIPWARKIPIIAMTANVFQGDIEKCLQAGMDDHIGKPISDTVLYEKLAFYLHNVENWKKEAQEVAAQTEAVVKDTEDPAEFLPYLDLKQGLSRLRENKKLYATLLGSFGRNKKFEELLRDVEEERPAEAAASAHALKGIAGNIELTALYQGIVELEAMLKEGVLPRPEVMAALEETYQKTVDLIPAATKYLSKGIEG